MPSKSIEISTAGGFDLEPTPLNRDLGIGGNGFFFLSWSMNPNEKFRQLYAHHVRDLSLPDEKGNLQNAAGYYLPAYP